MLDYARHARTFFFFFLFFFLTRRLFAERLIRIAYRKTFAILRDFAHELIPRLVETLVKFCIKSTRR